MIATLRDLGATDPGLLFTIGLFFGAALGIAGVVLCAWERAPRPESPSERKYRLDAEAQAAANRAGYERLGRSANR